MTDLDKTNAVRDYIAQTTGTFNHYRHSFSRLRYTDGVLFVAETLGAHWLVDLIASHQLKRKVATCPFQVWRLTREGGRWFARCWTDTPDKSTRLVVQGFDYSDFPKDLLPFDLWVEDCVLILPAEH